MKKNIKMFILIFIAFFLINIPVSAKEVTLDELVKEIGRVEENASYAYIVGEYVFTSEHILTTQDLMLAARTINLDDVDGITSNTSMYNQMSIQTITRIVENFEVKGWEVDKNLLGNKILDLNDNKKININYIDYQKLKEDSNYSLNLEDTSEKEYQDILTEYGFSGNANSSSNLKLDGNKLTGLIKRNDDVTAFTGIDKTNYYFAFVIDIPDAKETTTIKLEGKNVVSATYDDIIELSNGKKGLVVLWALDPNASNKTIKITVDLDGNDEIYGDTIQTIDWSSLEFEEVSQASIDLSSATAADNKIMQEDWGYRPNANIDLQLKDWELNGTLVEQTLTSNDAFGKANKTGYYFDFKFVLPDNAVKGKVKIEQLVNKESLLVKKEFSQDNFDEEGNLTILFRFPGEQTNCTSSCKLYYRIDIDGSDDKYSPVIYEIDYSKVIFQKASKFTIDAVSSADINENWKGWSIKKGYQTTFTPDENDSTLIKLTGVLPIFNDNFTEEVFNDKSPYYLGFVLETDLGSEEDNIKIEFIQDDELILNKNDFSNNKKIYILKSLKDVGPSERNFRITIDWDDNATNYGAYSLTIDWSELELQQRSINSTIEVLNSNIGLPEKDSSDLTNFGYDFTLSQINLLGNSLNGVIRQQILNEAAGYSELEGYYVPLKIIYPSSDEYKKYSNNWRVKLYTKDGIEKLVIPTEEEYAQGFLIVLAQLDREANDTKTIKYEIDYDEGDIFLPETVEINYNNIDFKSANQLSYKYLDENGTIQNEKYVVYENDKIAKKPTLSPNKYHTFDYWVKEDTKEIFNFDLETVKKDTDINLVAHWTLDTDTFVNDIVNDLNNSLSENGDHSSVFNLSKLNNEITFKVLNPTTSLNYLNNTTIPKAIAYVLNKGEIEEITLKLKDKQVVFTHDGINKESSDISIDEDGLELEEIIKRGSTALFIEVLTDVSDMTLNKMAVNNITFDIIINKLNDSVSLKDSVYSKYKIGFASNIAIVQNEEELISALNNTKISNINIAKDFNVEKQHTISRPVIINGLNDTSYTLTATGSQSSIFIIDSKEVIINNLAVKGANTGIIINNTGSLTSKNVDFTGSITSGIEVKNGGIFTASELKYDGEKYDNPLLKVENGYKANSINITTNDEQKINPTVVEEVIKYNAEESTAQTITIGDVKQNKANYNYTHYYLNNDVANRWVKIVYTGNRALTGFPCNFVRFYDKESSGSKEDIEPPIDIKYLTTYSDSLADYTIENWVIGESVKYPYGSVPAPNNDIYYNAELKATYKTTTKKVNNEAQLKEALTNNEEVKVIIIDGTIELSDVLTINKSNILITGSDSGKVKLNGEIKGQIEINADNVVLSQLKVTGSTNNPLDNDNYIVTINGNSFRSSEVTYKADELSNGKVWDGVLHYIHDNPTSQVYFNNFHGENLKTFIDFDKKISGNTRIIGNDFTGSSTTKNFIVINDIDNDSKIEVKQTTASFVGEDEYGIRLKAPSSPISSTLELGNLWFNSKDKVLQIAIEVTADNHDASGLQIKAGSIYEDKIKVFYIENDSQPQNSNPYGSSYNVILDIK